MTEKQFKTFTVTHPSNGTNFVDYINQFQVSFVNIYFCKVL